jgi:AcrR family transcriptional regulator
MRIADRGGIDAVTMRGLGQELHVEAMSLYNHVANKDDILNAIVDAVEGEIELPDPNDPWKVALRKTATSYHDALGQHPWAASLALRLTGSRPARYRYMNGVLGTLRRAGFSDELTELGYHTLESHVAGFTLWVAQLQVDDDGADPADLAMRFLDEVSTGEYPFLVEHVHQHMKPSAADTPSTFAFGLDLILDGLERALAAG